jgi:hypothetical protein
MVGRLSNVPNGGDVRGASAMMTNTQMCYGEGKISKLGCSANATTASLHTIREHSVQTQTSVGFACVVVMSHQVAARAP